MKGSHPEDFVLVDFGAGGLTKAARLDVAAHLEACARCRDVFTSLTEDTNPSGSRLAPDFGLERTRPGDPLIGKMLGEYKVLQRLGQGGMGVLYRGEQPVIGKVVAIKVLLQTIAADATLVQRMIGEARAVNAVRHPNIVDIFSFGQLPDGRPYMVMELLEGLSLAELQREKGRLTPAQVLVVLSQSMAALEAAHEAGVIHRDLKPDNIFVDPRPEGWNLTLLDFGLAKQEGSTERGLTRPGTVVGTPGYMAPEQVRGDAGVSAKTDIYAMGIVAWTLLAGREPFEGGSVVEIMHRHLKTPAPPLTAEVGALPPGLEPLVMQMLEKDPARRPTATEVLATVTGIASVPAAAATPAPKPSRSLTGLLIAAIVGVGSVLVCAGWWVNSDAAIAAPPVNVARPIEPPPIPVAAPQPVDPPAPVADVAPVIAPLPPPPPRTWRCAKVVEVGPVVEVLNGPWDFFVLNLEDEPRVLVTTARTKKNQKDLQKLATAIKACRGSSSVLIARRVNESHEGLMTANGFFRGMEVGLTDLSVASATP